MCFDSGLLPTGSHWNCCQIWGIRCWFIQRIVRCGNDCIFWHHGTLATKHAQRLQVWIHECLAGSVMNAAGVCWRRELNPLWKIFAIYSVQSSLTSSWMQRTSPYVPWNGDVITHVNHAGRKVFREHLPNRWSCGSANCIRTWSSRHCVHDWLLKSLLWNALYIWTWGSWEDTSWWDKEKRWHLW